MFQVHTDLLFQPDDSPWEVYRESEPGLSSEDDYTVRYQKSGSKKGSKFPVVLVNGDTPHQRGFDFGQQLPKHILNTANFYICMFIRELGANLSYLKEFAGKSEVWLAQQPGILGDCHSELCGISHGSGVPLWKLYVLNYRTEILHCLNWRRLQKSLGKTTVKKKKKEEENSTVKVRSVFDYGECTGLMNASLAINSQNWDWTQVFESWLVIRVDNDLGTVMVTEPGMIGKSGYNARSGLSVTMQLLSLDSVPYRMAEASTSVPFHLLVRLVLQHCHSVDEVLQMMRDLPIHTRSVMGLCDSRGDGGFLEIADDWFTLVRKDPKCQPKCANRDGWLAHSNHYVSEMVDMMEVSRAVKKVDRSSVSEDTFDRLDKANELIERHHFGTVDGRVDVVKSVLFNREGESPVLRKSDSHHMTVVSMIFDLRTRTVHFTRQNPREQLEKSGRIRMTSLTFVHSKL